MSKGEISKYDIIQHVSNNYLNLEQSIVAQLLLETPNHHSTSGSYREQVWASFFRQIIPKKFSIAQSIFIIDSSHDNLISKEVDLAIYDEQYTPYIFNYGKIKFIPIEAVAIVVQCKSDNVIGKQNAKILIDWVERINNLKTNSNSIARMATNIAMMSPSTQKSTTPIKILCAQKKCVDKIGEPKYGFDIAIFPELIKGEKRNELSVYFSEKINDLYKAYHILNHPRESFIDFFDYKSACEINLSNETDRDKKYKMKSNLECYEKLHEKKLNHYKVDGNRVLSLIFQLNQLLMLINNPMLFPHEAYAKMFDRIDRPLKQ